MRHSAAARMISLGAYPKVIQSIMDQRSEAFTLNVYGHMCDADLDELAAKLELSAASAAACSLASDRRQVAA